MHGRDDQRYLAFLRDADPPLATSRFPILPFAFMIAMAVAVVALGLGLIPREAGSLAPGETRGAESAGGTGNVPHCDGLTERQARRIDDAVSRMRRTREGATLADQLVKHDVCVGVEDLAYNAAYASPNRSWTGDWDDSYIAIDGELVAAAENDVLAAILVHEATHIDRAIRGDGCGFFDGCDVLDNGVVVEEEVAAHAAEARWWIEIYGAGGRRVYAGYGYSFDALAAAYLMGDDSFRNFVVQIRSDPRDGADI